MINDYFQPPTFHFALPPLNTDSQTSIKSAKNHCYSPKPEIFRLQSYLKKPLHNARKNVSTMLMII